MYSPCKSMYSPCIVLSMYYTIHVWSSPCIVQSMYGTVHALYSPYILHSMYCTVHVWYSPCIVQSMYCTTPCTVQSTYATVHAFYSLYIVWCMHCTGHVLYTPCTVHSMYCTVHVAWEPRPEMPPSTLPFLHSKNIMLLKHDLYCCFQTSDCTTFHLFILFSVHVSCCHLAKRLPQHAPQA